MAESVKHDVRGLSEPFLVVGSDGGKVRPPSRQVLDRETGMVAKVVFGSICFSTRGGVIVKVSSLWLAEGPMPIPLQISQSMPN